MGKNLEPGKAQNSEKLVQAIREHQALYGEPAAPVKPKGKKGKKKTRFSYITEAGEIKAELTRHVLTSNSLVLIFDNIPATISLETGTNLTISLPEGSYKVFWPGFEFHDQGVRFQVFALI